MGADRDEQVQPDEYFQSGPVSVARFGSHLLLRNQIAPGDRPAWREWRASRLQQLPAEIERLEREIVTLCDPYDAFALVEALQQQNAPGDPNTYVESESTGVWGRVEYGALLLLRRSDRGGTGDAPPGQDLIAELDNKLDKALRLSVEWRVGTLLGEEPEPLDEVRARVVGREFIIRSPAFDWQERATVEALFQPPGVNDSIDAKLGFRVEHAILLTDTIIAAVAGSIAASRGVSEVDLITAQVEQVRAGGAVPNDRSAGLVAWLAQEPPRTAAVLLEFLKRAGESAPAVPFEFTAIELAKACRLSEETVQKYLDHFALEFGAVVERPPPQLERVRRRPLLRDRGGQYICAVGADLLWAVRPALEEALKPTDGDADGRPWNRYEAQRRRRTEQRAFELLRDALRPDWAEPNVRYRLLAPPSGAPFEGELDGVLKLGSALFLVEAKGKSLPPSARRGGESLEQTLKRNLRRQWIRGPADGLP